MFDVKLYEIFEPLGIGIMAAVLMAYFYFLFFKLFNIRRYNKDAFTSWLKTNLQNDYTKSGYAVIVSIAIYGLGILTQDFTDHLSDSENSGTRIVNIIKRVGFLDREGDLRMETLLKNDSAFTGLGSEIFSNLDAYYGPITSKNNIDFTVVRDRWKEAGPGIMKTAVGRKNFISLVNDIYYTSKNWCYMNSEPVRDELQNIENRVDLSRSICTIAFFSLFIIVLLFFSYYVRELLKGPDKSFKVLVTEKIGFYNGRWLPVRNNSAQGYNKTTVVRKVLFPVRSFICLLIILFGCRICYMSSEYNFNERALGYYISYLKQKRAQAPAQREVFVKESDPTVKFVLSKTQ